jgi:hypothetical protein
MECVGQSRGKPERPPPTDRATRADTALTVTVDFQFGFAGQLVSLRVDGRDIATRERVVTNAATGFARRYELKSEPGFKSVEITISDGSGTKRFSQGLLLAGDTTLGVQYLQYWDGKDIALVISRRPFLYD